MLILSLEQYTKQLARGAWALGELLVSKRLPRLLNARWLGRGRIVQADFENATFACFENGIFLESTGGLPFSWVWKLQP